MYKKGLKILNTRVFMFCGINGAITGVFAYLLFYNKHVLLCINKKKDYV